MWTEQVIGNLPKHRIYHRKELYSALRESKSDMSESAFRWAIYNLEKDHKLFRIDYDSYVTEKPEILPSYRPSYSEQSLSLTEWMEGRYPDVSFVVLESTLLNEFLNHQIAQNTIYLQVERELSSCVFDSLREGYTGNILYKPGKKEFERYWLRDCIVVLDLVSDFPANPEKTYQITAEKLLVDIISDKSIAATFSPAEIPTVYRNMLEGYRVDKRRLNRYAGRRGKAEAVERYWEECNAVEENVHAGVHGRPAEKDRR